MLPSLTSRPPASRRGAWTVLVAALGTPPPRRARQRCAARRRSCETTCAGGPATGRATRPRWYPQCWPSPKWRRSSECLCWRARGRRALAGEQVWRRGLRRVPEVLRPTGGAAAPPPAAASTTAPLFTGACLDDDVHLESVLYGVVVRPLAPAAAVGAAGAAAAPLRRRDAASVADLATSAAAAARVHLAAGDEPAAVTSTSATGRVAVVAALPAVPLPVRRRLGEVGKGVGPVNARHGDTCLRSVVHKLAGSTAAASGRQKASPPASPIAMSDGEGGGADADNCAADSAAVEVTATTATTAPTVMAARTTARAPPPVGRSRPPWRSPPRRGPSAIPAARPAPGRPRGRCRGGGRKRLPLRRRQLSSAASALQPTGCPPPHRTGGREGRERRGAPHRPARVRD